MFLLRVWKTNFQKNKIFSEGPCEVTSENLFEVKEEKYIIKENLAEKIPEKVFCKNWKTENHENTLFEQKKCAKRMPKWFNG